MAKKPPRVRMHRRTLSMDDGRSIGTPPAGNALRHKSRGAWDTLRRQILQRDCGLCVLCQAAGRVEAAHQVDHRIPVSEGGTDHPDNLQSLCIPCHKTKTAAEARRRSTG